MSARVGGFLNVSMLLYVAVFFDVFVALHAPRWRMPSDASMIEKYGIATTVATRQQLTLKQLNNALDVL